MFVNCKGYLKKQLGKAENRSTCLLSSAQFTMQKNVKAENKSKASLYVFLSTVTFYSYWTKRTCWQYHYYIVYAYKITFCYRELFQSSFYRECRSAMQSN